MISYFVSRTHWPNIRRDDCSDIETICHHAYHTYITIDSAFTTQLYCTTAFQTLRMQKHHSHSSSAILNLHYKVIPKFMIMHKCTNNFDKMKMTSIFQKEGPMVMRGMWWGIF